MQFLWRRVLWFLSRAKCQVAGYSSSESWETSTVCWPWVPETKPLKSLLSQVKFILEFVFCSFLPNFFSLQFSFTSASSFIFFHLLECIIFLPFDFIVIIFFIAVIPFLIILPINLIGLGMERNSCLWSAHYLETKVLRRIKGEDIKH